MQDSCLYIRLKNSKKRTMESKYYITIGRQLGAGGLEFAKKLSDDYGEFSFKNIAGMIKLIAFVVSIGVALLFLVAAAIVFILDKTLFFLSALILLFGFAVALISLYLIYGLGLLISQNKEILRRLDSLDNEDY